MGAINLSPAPAGSRARTAPARSAVITGSTLGTPPLSPIPGRGNGELLAVSSLDWLSYCCSFRGCGRPAEVPSRSNTPLESWVEHAGSKKLHGRSHWGITLAIKGAIQHVVFHA
jgi:hypothetical protein